MQIKIAPRQGACPYSVVRLANGMATVVLASVGLSGCSSPLFAPENVVVEGDVSWQASGDFTYWAADRHYAGAIGRAALVMDIPVHPRFNLRYGLEHRSYANDSRDRGEERAFAGFEWRPFRHRK